MRRHKPKNKKNYFFLALLLIVLFALKEFKPELISPQEEPQTSTSQALPQENITTTGEVYFLPSSTTNQIIEHSTYYLSYSEEHEQAEWVAYELTPEHLSGGKYKRPHFSQDPKVSTKSAHSNTYKNSGYTRGHLLPAGDRIFSKEAYDETFFTSNISPQLAEFNTGIWNSLEMKVRNFVKKNGKVYVVTGGVLTDNLETIGAEKVAVPEYFYKVLLHHNGKQYQMRAYLIPHKEERRKKLPDYLVAVDSIEALTGIDFFPFLEDTLEEELESKVELKGWF